MLINYYIDNYTINTYNIQELTRETYHTKAYLKNDLTFST